MDFINTIIHRSVAIRPRAQRLIEAPPGPVGAEDWDGHARVMAPRSFWDQYGFVTGTGLAVFAGTAGFAVVSLVTGPGEGPAFAHYAIIGMLLTAALGVLALPAMFYARHREHAAMLSDDAAADGSARRDDGASTRRALRGHLNAHKRLDGPVMATAGAVILIMALVQLGLVMVPLIGGDFALDRVLHTPSDGMVFYLVCLLAIAPFNFILGVAALQNGPAAVSLAFYVSIFNALVSFASGSWLIIGANLALAGLLLLLYLRVRVMVKRVAAEKKQNPFTAYYHNLIAALIWIMRADGDCDRREREKIDRVCDGIDLSFFERELVAGAVRSSPRGEIGPVAERLREAAEIAGLESKGHEALVAALAVATADGILVDEEAAGLRQLGAALDVQSEETEALIHQHGANLEELDATRAREILGLADGDAPAAIESAYRELMDDLQPARYEHLGPRLMSYVARRRTVVERAYAILGEEG